MDFFLRLALYLTTPCIVSSFAKAFRANNVSLLVESQLLQSPFPYDFPDQSHAGDKLFPMEQCQGLTLEEAAIDQLSQWMSAGKLTTQQLVTCYDQRIEQTDGYTKLVASSCLSLSLSVTDGLQVHRLLL